MSKATKYREMTVDELLNEENEIRTALFNLRVGSTTKELENTARLRSTKRDLARILTMIREKTPSEAEQN